MPDHHRILILGGGTAGMTVAARLRRAAAHLDIRIVEPSESHLYQPLWTLVEADFIPAGVDWIRDRVTEILPDQKTVATASGRRLAYDWLVVALGIQIDWTAIPGLAAGIGTRVLREGVQSPITVTPFQDSRKRKVFVERWLVQTKWRDFDKAHILLGSGLQPRVALCGKTHLVAAGKSHKDHSALMPCLQGTVSQGARAISV